MNNKINKDIVNKYSNITDGLGLGLDEGIIVCVAYLNEFGYNTNASCEGHIDHGVPYAWIDFISDYAAKIKSDINSATVLVANETRTKVNKLEKKLGTKEFNKKYGSWVTLYFEELCKHPKYKEYMDEKSKKNSRQPLLEKNITSLVNDFCKKKKVKKTELYTFKLEDEIRLNFCTKKELNKIDKEFSDDRAKKKNWSGYKEKSDKLIRLFEEYLVERFYKKGV